MEKYEYKTLTVDARRASTPDAVVGERLQEALQDKWEYLNGPTVTGEGVYVFMLRRPTPSQTPKPAMNDVGIAKDPDPIPRF